LKQETTERSATTRKAPNFRKFERQSRFLAALSGCGSILRASRLARIDRTTHYVWMREDPTYRERFEEARQQAARGLEDEAVRRAWHGVRKPVLYKGKQVYIQGEPLFETEYSDALLALLLKANDPERFGDRQRITLDLKDWDGDISKLSPAQVDALLAKALEKVGMTEESLQKAIEAGHVVEVQPEPAGEPKS
jgi:hypothetical protein